MLLCSTACQTAAPVKTKIVEVKVPVVTAIPPEMTAKPPKPQRPPLRCRDARGTATLCNRDLADWLNAYDALVDTLYRKLNGIRRLQPKGEK